ncbi:hypothetical protein Taro_015573 [Colocasia esculenta]|uniref:Ribosomal RNA small subunit methyltransferase G n=1 Tax=Colocasia esculenta TaxID=4460 RepID=A0A843UQB8_COLES|nr:hypothetical protein [Colocasia esculenta]
MRALETFLGSGRSCKLLAAPPTPALARSPGRRRCSVPLSLFKALTTGAAGLLTTAAAARPPTTASDTGGNETSSVTGSGIRALSPLQQEQITTYVRTLLEWNQRMNLTAVTEESEVMTRHVEDSLAIIPPLRRHYVSRCCGRGGPVSSDGGRLSVVDVGTGPGLPGLILAIACPDWKLTLLESMRKRCLFLEHVIGLIGLSNVQVLHERAECVGQNLNFREVFDVAVARAVAEMRTLGLGFVADVYLLLSDTYKKNTDSCLLTRITVAAEYCLPLVRVGGLFVAAKGYDPQEEVENAQNTVRLLGASIIDLCSVESQGPHGQRTAVICYKERATPKKYPRQTGVPSKMPL